MSNYQPASTLLSPAGIAACSAEPELARGPLIATPRIDSLAVGITWLLVLSIVQRGIGFGRNMLVCRYLDPVELGRWNLIFQFFMMAAPLLVLGIPGTFGRYVETFRLRGQLRDFLRRTVRATLLCTAIGLIVLALGHRWVAYALFHDSAQASAALVIGLILAVVVVSNLLGQLLAALRLPRALSMVNFFNTGVFTLVSIGLLLMTDWGAIGVAVGYGSGCVTAIVCSLYVLRQWSAESMVGASSPTAGLWRKLFPLAVWMWTSDLCFNLFAVVDRYMIVHMSGHSPDEALGLVGQYHSGHVLGLLLVSLGDLLSSVALPYLTHDWETGQRRAVVVRINRSLQLVALLLTTCAGFMICLAPVLFDYVLQGKYATGRELLPMTMAFCIWYALSFQLKNYLWVSERGYWITVAVGFGVLANIGLNLLWLPAYGLWGAVAATAVANALVLVGIATCSAIYGWRCDLGTVAAMVLPGLLAWDAGVSLTACGLLLVWGLRNERFLSESGQSRLDGLISVCLAPLARLRGSGGWRPQTVKR